MTVPDELQAFIKGAPWRWAKTYARTWPHWYVVRDHLDSRRQEQYRALIRFYLDHCYEGRFFNTTVWYLDIDGWTYWGAGKGYLVEDHTLLNRCEIEECYMHLWKHGLLKERLRERRLGRENT